MKRNKLGVIGVLLAVVMIELMPACKKNTCSSDLPVPSIEAVGPTTFCRGSVLLKTGGFAADDYEVQWQRDGSDISGATGLTYTATAAGKYQARINEKSCINYSWSAPMQVTLNTALVSAITLVGSADLCKGKPVLYANTCEGYTYRWKKNGEYIEGAESAVLSPQETGEYQVEVSDGTNKAWSAVVAITTCK
jgi:hypothetical protein